MGFSKMKFLATISCLVILQATIASSYSAASAFNSASDGGTNDNGKPTTTTAEETEATQATTVETDATETTTTTTTSPTTTTPPSSSICDACDNDAVVEIDLKTEEATLSTGVTGSMEGINVTSFTDPSSSNPCNTQALVEVDFHLLPACNAACYSGCLTGTNCSRRILRVDLEYNETQSGWLFNFGDSSTNNGWGGDGSTQTNDAEVHCTNGTVYVYSSDKCSTLLDTLPGGCNASVTESRIEISNEQFNYTSNTVDNYIRCEPDCLFALNDQPDPTGPTNERIFIGLNRVVSNSNRNGYGICKARLRWACTACN